MYSIKGINRQLCRNVKYLEHHLTVNNQKAFKSLKEFDSKINSFKKFF